MILDLMKMLSFNEEYKVTTNNNGQEFQKELYDFVANDKT